MLNEMDGQIGRVVEEGVAQEEIFAIYTGGTIGMLNVNGTRMPMGGVIEKLGNDALRELGLEGKVKITFVKPFGPLGIDSGEIGSEELHILGKEVESIGKRGVNKAIWISGSDMLRNIAAYLNAVTSGGVLTGVYAMETSDTEGSDARKNFKRGIIIHRETDPKRYNGVFVPSNTAGLILPGGAVYKRVEKAGGRHGEAPVYVMDSIVGDLGKVIDEGEGRLQLKRRIDTLNFMVDRENNPPLEVDFKMDDNIGQVKFSPEIADSHEELLDKASKKDAVIVILSMSGGAPDRLLKAIKRATTEFNKLVIGTTDDPQSGDGIANYEIRNKFKLAGGVVATSSLPAAISILKRSLGHTKNFEEKSVQELGRIYLREEATWFSGYLHRTIDPKDEEEARRLMKTRAGKELWAAAWESKDDSAFKSMQRDNNFFSNAWRWISGSGNGNGNGKTKVKS